VQMHLSMHVHPPEGVVERDGIGRSLAAVGQTHVAGDLDTPRREALPAPAHRRPSRQPRPAKRGVLD
jgi:hypothetical protein